MSDLEIFLLLKHVTTLNGFLKCITHIWHFRSHKVLLSYNSGLAQHLLKQKNSYWLFSWIQPFHSIGSLISMQKPSPLVKEVTLLIHTLHVTKQRYGKLQRFVEGQTVTLTLSWDQKVWTLDPRQFFNHCLPLPLNTLQHKELWNTERKGEKNSYWSSPI